MSIYATISLIDYALSGIKDMRDNNEVSCDLLLSYSRKKAEYLHVEKRLGDGKLMLDLYHMNGTTLLDACTSIPYGNDGDICKALQRVLIPERRAAG